MEVSRQKSSEPKNKQQIAVAIDQVELRNFARAEEVRTFPYGKLELLKMGGIVIGRATLEPGWRWSTSVQPLAKTTSCEAAHFQYHVSGRLMVHMDNGKEYECRPGDISLIPQGHDAWVIGNEPVVIVDFQGMMDYAKESSHH